MDSGAKAGNGVAVGAMITGGGSGVLVAAGNGGETVSFATSVSKTAPAPAGIQPTKEIIKKSKMTRKTAF
jgi:hypothetical protein